MRNVVSNLGFLLVGIAGVWWSVENREQLGADLPAAIALFAATGLTAFGSSWFHLEPLVAGKLNRFGLLLDRLPMTIAFAALLALVLRDRMFRDAGSLLLLLLLATGLATLAYWYVCNRLFPYAFFQGYAALGTLLLIGVLRPTYTGAGYVVAGVFLFGAAKAFEAFDAQIYRRLRFGGHPLKHIAGALAALMILWWLVAREPMPPAQ
jgi:hypothetical protein